MKNVVTRFAPSPTGYLHIGGLRTALFSFLPARHHQGQFRLRIEDTDQKRLVPGADEQLITTFTTLGLSFDGDIVYQSKRVATGIYRTAAETLLGAGHAYYCFCTEERLTVLRAEQVAKKEPPGYDGHCRTITPDEARARIASGEPTVVRLRMPDTPTSSFHDELRGAITFARATLEDAVLLKSDGFPTYHLASVVDDHGMEVSHVIRGEEWLPSAPLHALVYEYLGYELPKFYHLPLILNPDKSKLSKRQGDVAVEDYLAKGYLPEALINYVALLGWNAGDNREIYSLPELIKVFSVDRLNVSPAVFNITKLNWFNSEYIKNNFSKLSEAEMGDRLAPYLPELSSERRVAVLRLFFERINYLGQLPETASFLFTLPTYDAALLIFKKSTKEKTITGFTEARKSFEAYDGAWTAPVLETLLKEVTAQAQLTFGDVFWPVRVALSGLVASPPPADIAAYLGKEETLKRLKEAIMKLTSE